MSGPGITRAAVAAALCDVWHRQRCARHRTPLCSLHSLGGRSVTLTSRNSFLCSTTARPDTASAASSLKMSLIIMGTRPLDLPKLTPSRYLLLFQLFPQCTCLLVAPTPSRQQSLLLTLRSALGDAAHATSPAIGQGMNTALADALAFDELLDKHGDDLQKVLPGRQTERTRTKNIRKKENGSKNPTSGREKGRDQIWNRVALAPVAAVEHCALTLCVYADTVCVQCRCLCVQ
eukprot:3737325-Rhodomonas_salina.1